MFWYETNINNTRYPFTFSIQMNNEVLIPIFEKGEYCPRSLNLVWKNKDIKGFHMAYFSQGNFGGTLWSVYPFPLA